MTIHVNGDAREADPGTTLRQLVESYGFSVEKVALERNRKLVRADAYDEPLAENDVIEIVTFVGGG